MFIGFLNIQCCGIPTINEIQIRLLINIAEPCKAISKIILWWKYSLFSRA